MRILLRLISCLFLQALINSSLYASDDQLLEILKTYNDNQARFHLNHKGKIFKGEGMVWGIIVEPSKAGRYFLVDIRTLASSLIAKSVKDTFDPIRVRCVVYDMKLAASLDKSQLISFSGVVNDVESNNILILKECKLRN
jgi:hypothetical protein